ncbi:DUF1836 domain-containing protein [Defluviitalea phaphyphila]|uniref:DUF1836 domain-containing protein n=1 Tax=Defluviitalea phaphyphila TaxID=1473580 RepID=UPI000730269B|nr:DUF1836 domain-containing protein [Defluviitalea phaphyphila]
MNFNKDIIKELIEEFNNLNVIELLDIPKIDLYMDQVTTFFDDQLESWKVNKKDKILTKTMINNYTKAGILFPPIKKKYSNKHMILLILIYHLKQILSLDDIHTLLSPVIEENMLNESKNFSSLYSIYEQFLNIQKEEIKNFVENFSNKIDSLYDKNDFKNDNEYYLLFITIVNLIISSNIQRIFAEKLIDKFKELQINKE